MSAVTPPPAEAETDSIVLEMVGEVVALIRAGEELTEAIGQVLDARIATAEDPEQRRALFQRISRELRRRGESVHRPHQFGKCRR